MKKHLIYKILFAPALIILLQSCFVAKDYQRPKVANETHYRTDQLPQDSLSLAEVSWKELFTDSILVGHIEAGLEQNIDIRIALQQIIAANAYYRQGKAGYLPTLDATARVTHQELSKNSQFGSFFDGGITQYELLGSLSWEADIWGRIRSTKRASEASYLQSVAAHQAVKTLLISNIASMYYQLLALDEQQRITEENIRIRETGLEVTQALKEAGNVTEVGVKQTEAQLYTAKALLIDIKVNIKLLENTLSILLGNGPQAIERSNLDQQEIDNELQVGFPVQLLRNRPDVIAAEYGLINGFELTNVAKSNFYPSLNITATGGLQSLEFDKLFNLNSLFATVVGSVTQPVFNRRRIKTQYEVAKSQQEQAYLRFRQTLLTASKEVSDALYAYEAAEEKTEIRTKEYEAYDLASTYSEELLNSGFANYLEVLTARQNALNAQLGLINARFDRLNAVVDLYRALGGGWQ